MTSKGVAYKEKRLHRGGVGLKILSLVLFLGANVQDKNKSIMIKIIKIIVSGIANVVNCYTFATTVPVLLPIRTACGSSYLIPFLVLSHSLIQ